MDCQAAQDDVRVATPDDVCRTDPGRHLETSRRSSRDCSGSLVSVSVKANGMGAIAARELALRKMLMHTISPNLASLAAGTGRAWAPTGTALLIVPEKRRNHRMARLPTYAGHAVLHFGNRDSPTRTLRRECRKLRLNRATIASCRRKSRGLEDSFVVSPRLTAAAGADLRALRETSMAQSRSVPRVSEPRTARTEGIWPP